MSTAIQSELREVKPKSVIKTLRKQGYIPAIVYGYQTDATPIAVKERDVVMTVRKVGRYGVMKLSVDGKELNVMLGEYQEDVLNGSILHADFLAVNLDEELEVEIPVHTVGEALGEKDGGVLQQPTRELKIKVKPADVPEMIDIDVSNLQIGDTILVSDIRDAHDFEILNDDEEALVVITAPQNEVVEEEEEITEPEVIGEAPKED